MSERRFDCPTCGEAFVLRASAVTVRSLQAAGRARHGAAPKATQPTTPEPATDDTETTA